MAIKKIQIVPPDNSYGDILHPETDSTVVKMASGNTLEVDFIAHTADYVAHGNAVIAGGTANALTFNTGGKWKWVQGARLMFKTTITNTGAVTVSIDGATALTILLPAGDNLSAGALVAHTKFYEIIYDPARNPNYFFLLARTSGNAVAGDVLAGKTFSNDAGEQVGTGANAKGFASGTLNVTIPKSTTRVVSLSFTPSKILIYYGTAAYETSRYFYLTFPGSNIYESFDGLTVIDLSVQTNQFTIHAIHATADAMVGRWEAYQ